MGYVRTAGMSTAQRRARRRAALVIASLLIGLLLVFAVALAAMQGWITLSGGGAADDVQQTTSAPAPTVKASDVVVNVFNATDTAGLASRAADGLRARGFAVDAVGNDSVELEGVGVIRHGPTGLEGATLLKDSLPKGITLVADDRESTVVDLVLGTKWEDLPTAEDATSTGKD
ncbi:MAG: LytR C-terminal domain-containing protein [Ornithinimicrobium sp.]|uniref:LytR C-terminal domain-containing protein n=1 Tax=Ornithinimicrobium sp. TaxID=1977084 RepID=UPI0026DEDA75|nr:LytR C-terminal domain-containing protein [Ornithinimicrobium sp.]MDO5740840.1 LytR C-terminal domain-containing protein [Ornithinimicrobium sp.]